MTRGGRPAGAGAAGDPARADGDGPDDAAPPAPSSRRVQGPDGPVRVHVVPGRPVPRGEVRPVLLALHGWTNTGEVFGPLAAALDRRWSVVAPDAPGHGGTPWRPADRYRVADHAAGVAAVVDALPRLLGGGRRPVVVHGHSMGALTAARVAALRPDVVRHVVLEDPARTTPHRLPSTAAQLASVRRLQALTYEERLAEIATTAPHWPDDEYGPWARSKAEVDAAHLEVPTDWGEPLVELLSDVRCPVTLVRGEPARGGIVSATGARRCVAVCAAGGEVVALAAGHNPRRECRTAFVATLASVLGRYER